MPHVPGEDWTAKEILPLIAEALEENDAIPDSIEVLRATDHQFIGRVRYVGVDDYEGVMVVLDL